MSVLAEGARDAKGEWIPEDLPRPAAPYLRPFKWKEILKYFFSHRGHVASIISRRITLTLVVWYFLTPSLEQAATLRVGWILLIYLRNVALLTIIAGRLHWRLYVRKVQGMKYKYTNKWPATRDKKFMFGNQIWDNVFFSLVSGCGVWTAYEVLFLWGWGNNIFPMLGLDTHLGLLILITFFVPFYEQAHFYFTHRLIHWKPLYKIAHHVHHRNINFGPWTGISMHPIEHLIFFSAVLIFLVIPVHPLVVMMMLLGFGIGPAGGHAGYHKFLRKRDGDEKQMRELVYWGQGADFFHHLHHRFFTVNFGSNNIPLDKWLHTFHDGSPKAQAEMLDRRNAKAMKSRVPT